MNKHKITLELKDTDKIYNDREIDIEDILQTKERSSVSGCEQSKNIMDFYNRIKGDVDMRIIIASNNNILNKVNENHEKCVKGILLKYNVNNLTPIERNYCYYRFTMTYSVKQIDDVMTMAQSTQKIHYRAICEKYNISGDLDRGVKAAIMQNYWITEFPNFKVIKIIIVTH